MRYKAAPNHDVAEISLSTLNPQPRDGSVRGYRVRNDAGVTHRNLFSIFQWNILLNGTMYQSVLTQLGILTAKIAPVTIYTKDDDFDWKRYNGFAVQPEVDTDVAWDTFFVKNLSIYIYDLVEII